MNNKNLFFSISTVFFFIKLFIFLMICFFVVVVYCMKFVSISHMITYTKTWLIDKVILYTVYGCLYLNVLLFLGAGRGRGQFHSIDGRARLFDVVV